MSYVRERSSPTRSDRPAFPLILIAPVLLVEFTFVLTPLILGIYYSLHDVRYFQVGDFNGYTNYVRVLTSPAVLNSFVVTAIFSIISLVLTFGIGLVLALHLSGEGRGARLVRIAVLVPYIISMLVGSLLLRWMLSQESGVLGAMLEPFGISSFSVFAGSGSAMGALVLNAVWRDSAFAMILLLAGLKSIPLELYAAARVDGASAWYRFRRLTLPLLRVPILITLVRLLMHFINSLTYQLVLTGGGPAMTTETTALRVFRLGFEDYALGRANALSMIVFVVNMLMIGALILLFSSARKIR